MNVDRILRAKGSAVVSVAPTDRVADAAGLLSRHGIGAALVRDEKGALVGIFSERDVVRGVAASGEACLQQAVRDLMTRELVTCSPEDSVAQVMALMTGRRVRHLPVLRHGALVGVISIGDVVKHRLDEIESEARALRDYIATG